MEVKKGRLIFANHILLCLLFSHLIPPLMKPISSVIVFLLLVLSAMCTSIDSYRCAETAIVQDMNQALEKTLAVKREAWITPDTIQNYREYLRIKDLKSRSFVSYALEKNDYSLCSQRYQWQKGRHSLMFQSYADCSFGTIWGLSDQRLALFLTLFAMLWMLFSVVGALPVISLQCYFCIRTKNFSKCVATSILGAFGTMILLFVNEDFLVIYPYAQPSLALRARALVDYSSLQWGILLIICIVESGLFFILSLRQLK